MKRIFLLFTLFLFIGNVWALSGLGSTTDTGGLKVTNTMENVTAGSYRAYNYEDYPFLYILNNIDGENFVAPTGGLHWMRLGGASTWNRAGATQTQVRLQYFGWGKIWLCAADNCVADSYLEGSNLSKPFLGIACLTTDASKDPQCIKNGYIAAEYFQKEGVDSNPGFYHTHRAKGGYSGYANAFWSVELQNEIKNLPVDEKYLVTWVHCMAPDTVYTQELYDNGTRCIDIEDNKAVIAKIKLPLHKVAQLTFNATNGFEDIFVDTSGNISLLPSNQNCKLVTVKKMDGVSCTVAYYNYTSNGSTDDHQYFYLFYNADKGNTNINNYKAQIYWKSDNTDWIQISTKAKTANNSWGLTKDQVLSNTLAKKDGDGTLSIFLSQNFLKAAVQDNNNFDIYKTPDLLSFQFYNDYWKESGYYEFLPFTYLKILPKEHSIGIHSVLPGHQGNEGEGSGILGSNTPIDIQYKIISSYSDQEFLKNVSLKIDGIQATAKDGKQYCAFSDINGTGATIAVPQYVKYQTSESNFDSIETNCKKDGINLTPNYMDYDNKTHGSVYWEKFDWTADDSGESKGTIAETYIDLVFPMDDPISNATTDGSAFEGKVQSTGTLKVTATWNKVN